MFAFYSLRFKPFPLGVLIAKVLHDRVSGLSPGRLCRYLGFASQYYGELAEEIISLRPISGEPSISDFASLQACARRRLRKSKIHCPIVGQGLP